MSALSFADLILIHFVFFSPFSKLSFGILEGLWTSFGISKSSKEVRQRTSGVQPLCVDSTEPFATSEVGHPALGRAMRRLNRLGLCPEAQLQRARQRRLQPLEWHQAQ